MVELVWATKMTTHSSILGASLEAQTEKKSAYNAGDPGSITGSGKTSVEGNGYALQYSRLENFTDRGAWLSYSP